MAAAAPGPDDVARARDPVSRVARRTPVLGSAALSDLKCTLVASICAGTSVTDKLLTPLFNVNTRVSRTRPKS